MRKYPIQIIGIICWLPSHNPNGQRFKFKPAQNFLAITRFTRNLSGPDLNLSGPGLETLVNYSPYPENQWDCFKVRLYYRNLEGKKDDEIEKLIKYSDILIMEGYKVIAICRNLSVSGPSSGNMDGNWDSDAGRIR